MLKALATVIALTNAKDFVKAIFIVKQIVKERAITSIKAKRGGNQALTLLYNRITGKERGLQIFLV
jgi:hypothetical protein